MTVPTALGNLFAILPEEDIFLALFHGVTPLAADCEALRRIGAQPSPGPEPRTLKRRLRRRATVRHHDAAERAVLTAISEGARSAAVADLLLAAETDRVFADGWHRLDFMNKAFKCLGLIG